MHKQLNEQMDACMAVCASQIGSGRRTYPGIPGNCSESSILVTWMQNIISCNDGPPQPMGQDNSPWQWQDLTSQASMPYQTSDIIV